MKFRIGDLSSKQWRWLTPSRLREEVPAHYVPIHADNIASKDWVILLEQGTIVGSPDKLRLALTTTEKKIVTKYDLFRGAQHFLVLDGFNPRIHVLYFCPQLYRCESGNNLVPLEGDEIGKLLLQSLEEGGAEKKPWYEPSKKLRNEAIVSQVMNRARGMSAGGLPEPAALQAAE
ncbi:MAG TPA: hypothetical protein VIK79_00745 [Xanthobacteraceae bacterium]|jgi:hypothetical protein